MHLSQNDILALVLITGSKEPMNSSALQAELDLRRETVSRLITHPMELLAKLDRTPRSLEALVVETSILCDTLFIKISLRRLRDQAGAEG